MLKSIHAAFSTYSALPLPRGAWQEANLRYAIAALPLVGLLPGAALLLWQYFCARLLLSATLFAVGAVVLPILLTGGIHLDGFCDTVDALASQAERERKLKILKDPQSGAFAIIYCAAYLLLSLGLYAELYQSAAIFALAAGFVLSRAVVAISALTMNSARDEGMLVSFTRPAQKKTALLISSVLAVAAALFMLASYWRAAGVGAIICALAALLWYRRLTKANFGGITGDTCGFLLQLLELAILAGTLAGVIGERLA